MNSVDTNFLLIALIIAGVIFVTLFVFLLIKVSKMRQRVQDELSGKDGVYVGSGAKCLGNITLHKGAKVGANAVLLKDVPAYATAVGVPARIIEKK